MNACKWPTTKIAIINISTLIPEVIIFPEVNSIGMNYMTTITIVDRKENRHFVVNAYVEFIWERLKK